MQIIEILLLLLLVITFFTTFIHLPQQPVWLKMIPWMMLALIMVHVFVIDYRWQILPVYIFGVILLMLHFVLLMRNGKNIISYNSNFRKIYLIITGSIGSLILLCAILLTQLFPVVNIAPPAGEFSIGTCHLSLSDDNILEDSLCIQFWYPAEKTYTSEKEMLLPHSDNCIMYAGLVSGVIGVDIPSGTYLHFNEIITNSLVSAPVSNEQDKFPVIIISQGYTSTFNPNIRICEELASQGYIVINIKHNEFKKAQSNLFIKEFEKGRKINSYLSVSEEINNLWCDDLRFVIKELEAVNETYPLFTNRIDLSNIGVLGLGFGEKPARSLINTIDQLVVYIHEKEKMEIINSKQVSEKLMLVRNVKNSGKSRFSRKFPVISNVVSKTWKYYFEKNNNFWVLKFDWLHGIVQKIVLLQEISIQNFSAKEKNCLLEFFGNNLIVDGHSIANSDMETSATYPVNNNLSFVNLNIQIRF